MCTIATVGLPTAPGAARAWASRRHHRRSRRPTAPAEGTARTACSGRARRWARGEVPRRAGPENEGDSECRLPQCTASEPAHRRVWVRLVMEITSGKARRPWQPNGSELSRPDVLGSHSHPLYRSLNGHPSRHFRPRSGSLEPALSGGPKGRVQRGSSELLGSPVYHGPHPLKVLREVVGCVLVDEIDCWAASALRCCCG
jgi:hypothetical protein